MGVALPILWHVPEAAVTVISTPDDGSSSTDIMTCTGGCGYSFSTPDDGCGDTRNMYSDSVVNKYQHTVACSWIFI